MVYAITSNMPARSVRPGMSSMVARGRLSRHTTSRRAPKQRFGATARVSASRTMPFSPLREETGYRDGRASHSRGKAQAGRVQVSVGDFAHGGKSVDEGD